VPESLAPCAAQEEKSGGRQFPEPPPAYRGEYQRDRDRIIHSTAFRRLVYKTQVFVNHEGDLYRTRLTHSLEVAQIARTVARALGLNETLVEAISLAHDLGHTPFGHAGQDALNKCMQDFGGFEHNLQSLRVVDELEAKYADFPGLNLTWETREGILKHCSKRNARNLGDLGKRFLNRHQPSLEAQLVNLADAIAYNNHDVDDGLRSGLIKLEDLTEIRFLKDRLEAAERLHPGISQHQRIHEVVRGMIGALVMDLIDSSTRRIQDLAPANIEMVRAHDTPLIGFSEPFLENQRTLKRFLREKLYRHPKVRTMTERAHEVVTTLFKTFFTDYEKMPPEHAHRAKLANEEAGVAAAARVVSDYVAGMTDRFALQAHEALTSEPTAKG